MDCHVAPSEVEKSVRRQLLWHAGHKQSRDSCRILTLHQTSWNGGASLSDRIERMEAAREFLEHVASHHNSAPDGCPHYETLIWDHYRSPDAKGENPPSGGSSFLGVKQRSDDDEDG